MLETAGISCPQGHAWNAAHSDRSRAGHARTPLSGLSVGRGTSVRRRVADSFAVITLCASVGF
eukprot:1373809-Pyramimonas_sp.AAC.1